MLPRDRPDEIVLATTFGLVFTEDAGATWNYTCEVTMLTDNGFRYVLGPPSLAADAGALAGDRIFGVSLEGAPVSGDGACTWTLGAFPPGDPTDPTNPTLASDVFPDPSDPARVFAVAVPGAPAGAAGAIYRSMDGGVTYAGPSFTPSAGASTTGVEVSASAPDAVYVTWDQAAGAPRLSVSDDGGDTWTTLDLSGSLGAVKPYLAAIDPVDPLTVYLRVVTVAGAAAPFEGLAVTNDGGSSWSVPLMIAGGTLDGFIRRADGTLLAVGATPGQPSTLFQSSDGGRTFTPAVLPYHVSGLAQQGETLFLATSEYMDLVSLVSSTDGGQTWSSRLRLRNIQGIKACVYASCKTKCGQLAGLVFPPAACEASAAPAHAASGCGCGFGASGGARAVDALAAVLGLLLLRRRCRRSDGAGERRVSMLPPHERARADLRGDLDHRR